LYLVLLVINRELPIDALNTYLFTSQPCENMFRVARALSVPYSSVTNFSVKSFLRKCEKISIINSMKTHEGQSSSYHLQFPQHHKSDKKTYDYSNRSETRLSLTYDDIEKIIDDAFRLAQEYAALVNMDEKLTKRKIHSLSDLSQFVQSNLRKSSGRVVAYTRGSDTDTDDTESDSSYEEDVFQESDDTSDMNEHDEADAEDYAGDDPDVYDSDENVFASYHGDENGEDDPNGEEENLAKDLSKVRQKNFRGCRIYDKVSATNAFKFFRIRVGNSIKYVHKQTACWLLTDGKNRLSSDRLVRVRQSEE
jgi:hypothetical protein